VAVTRPTYVNLRELRGAAGVMSSAYMTRKLERALAGGSEQAERHLNRAAPGSTFYPQALTRKFDFPAPHQGESWRLWLDEHTLISVTSMTSGGVTLTEGTDYLLRPYAGPPYDAIEILLSGSATLGGGSTWQDDIVIVGEYGYDDSTVSSAVTVEALDASETAIDCGACPDIDAGDLITIDSERMLVTSTSLLDTGQNIGADLSADRTDDTVTVSDGTAYAADETITVDSERMLILDIAGNSLIVARSHDGSTLAAHTAGADIYARRTLNVTRGATGTTAATHLTSAAVYRQLYPPALQDLAMAEALNIFEQESSAYARTIGSGEAERAASGAGLNDIRKTSARYLRRERGPWVV
jgi:hypothetical protein